MAPTPEDLEPTGEASRAATTGERSDPSSETNSADPLRAEKAERRALLPEEETAGSDDPEAQADAILEESEHRQRDRSGTATEHRRSPDVVEPPD